VVLACFLLPLEHLLLHLYSWKFVTSLVPWAFIASLVSGSCMFWWHLEHLLLHLCMVVDLHIMLLWLTRHISLGLCIFLLLCHTSCSLWWLWLVVGTSWKISGSYGEPGVTMMTAGMIATPWHCYHRGVFHNSILHLHACTFLSWFTHLDVITNLGWCPWNVKRSRYI